MAAILKGEESLVADSIRSSKLLQGSLEQPMVLYDNRSKDRSRTPVAVLARGKPGSIYFSFVDDKGSFVGKKITFSL